MTDVATDITIYLNASPITWLTKSSDVPGVTGTLFAHDMPPKPDAAVSVIPYEGGPPKETFDNPFHVRNPRVQVMVRNLLGYVAMQKAEEILKYLNVKDETINGTKYERIKPVGEPYEIGPDTSNRQRAVINFEVSFYDSI